MKSFLAIFSSCALVVFLGSCEYLFDTSQDKEKLIYTLVYVDVSSSQDSASIAGMVNKLEEIMRSQPTDVETKLRIRFIDKDNTLEDIVYTPLKPLVVPSDDSIAFRDRLLESDLKLAREKIFQAFNENTRQKSRGNESCICNSLDNAPLLDSFKDTANCSLRIFVLSDMYEECSAKNSCFRVDFYMCQHNGKLESTESLKAKIANNYSPQDPLSNYVKPENLFFILTESPHYNENGKNCLQTWEVKEIWKEILKKMGYSDHEIDHKITYSYNIPTTHQHN